MPLAAQVKPHDNVHVNNAYARAAKIISTAEKGDAAAQFELGMLHERGDVVPQNHKEAAKWFRLAADAGYAPAQLYLGMLHASGKGVEKDFSEAIRLIRLAADQGMKDAQFLLGGIYFGDGLVPHNYVESYKWFRLAGRDESPERKQALEALVQRMSPQQFAEAERLVDEWSRSHKD